MKYFKRLGITIIAILLIAVFAQTALSNVGTPSGGNDRHVVHESNIWGDLTSLEGWLMDGFEDGTWNDKWDTLSWGTATISRSIGDYDSDGDKELRLSFSSGSAQIMRGGLVSKYSWDMQERTLSASFGVPNLQTIECVGITIASYKVQNSNPEQQSYAVSLYINYNTGYVCMNQRRGGIQTDWASCQYTGNDHRLKLDIMHLHYGEVRVTGFFDDGNDRWDDVGQFLYRQYAAAMYVYVWVTTDSCTTYTAYFDDIRGTGEDWFYNYIEHFVIKVWIPNQSSPTNWTQLSDKDFKYKERDYAKRLQYAIGCLEPYYIIWDSNDPNNVHYNYSSQIIYEYFTVTYEDVMQPDNFVDVTLTLRCAFATYDRSEFHLIVDVCMGSGSFAKQVRYWNGLSWMDIIKYGNNQYITYGKELKCTMPKQNLINTPWGPPNQPPWV